MTYYPTLEEDLARAKAILKEGRPRLEDFEEIDPQLRQENLRVRLLEAGGHIYGKDIYAAYKLLESFVEQIEKLAPEGECVCRTARCGHGARFHCGPGGACLICGTECWL